MGIVKSFAKSVTELSENPVQNGTEMPALESKFPDNQEIVSNIKCHQYNRVSLSTSYRQPRLLDATMRLTTLIRFGRVRSLYFLGSAYR